MIVVETLLEEIFSQLPDVPINGKPYKVNFSWGSDKELNNYLAQKTGNKYPLIWMVQSEQEDDDFTSSATRQIKLVIAKNSEHKTNINPTVWKSEFVNVLDPLLKNVKTALYKSGATNIVGGKSKTSRRANYTEAEQENGTYAIDFWNVIVFTALIRFEEVCINQIRF